MQRPEESQRVAHELIQSAIMQVIDEDQRMKVLLMDPSAPQFRRAIRPVALARYDKCTASFVEAREFNVYNPRTVTTRMRVSDSMFRFAADEAMVLRETLKQLAVNFLNRFLHTVLMDNLDLQQPVPYQTRRSTGRGHMICGTEAYYALLEKERSGYSKEAQHIFLLPTMRDTHVLHLESPLYYAAPILQKADCGIIAEAQLSSSTAYSLFVHTKDAPVRTYIEDAVLYELA